MTSTHLSAIERHEARARRRWRARRAPFVDMLKSYAAPLILAAFVTPALSPPGSRHAALGFVNYGLLIAGLVMIGLASYSFRRGSDDDGL